MFESDLSNNAVSTSMKTTINKRTRFTMIGSSSKLKNYRTNLIDKASQKLCKSVKKRINILGKP